GRGLGTTHNGEFGSGIGRPHGAGSLGSVRGNIDDAPSLPLADHELPDALGAEEDGGGINSQEMLPDIFPQLRDRHFIAANNGTGIVHQNINVAKVLRYLTYHGLNLLTIAQVTPHSLAAPAQRLHFLRHALNTTPLPPDFSRRQILWRPL